MLRSDFRNSMRRSRGHGAVCGNPQCKHHHSSWPCGSQTKGSKKRLQYVYKHFYLLKRILFFSCPPPGQPPPQSCQAAKWVQEGTEEDEDRKPAIRQHHDIYVTMVFWLIDLLLTQEQEHLSDLGTESF